MTNSLTLKKDKSNDTKLCTECNDRGDIFDFGYLLCAICYLDKYDPRRLDRLRKNKNLTR
jgi:hypothetical protein